MNPNLNRPFLIRLGRAFLYALRGVALVSRDRMFRCQLIAAVAAIVLAVWLRVSLVEAAILTLTIGSVLALEAMNSAIESAVDLAMPDQHPLAARAKDVAAGAVLIASIAAVGVGLLICVPRVLKAIRGEL